MSKKGRKLKLTNKLIKEAENLIKAGNFTTTVCDYLGIGQSTWYRWMQEGEQEGTGLKWEFWNTIKKAEAFAEIRNVNIIQQTANESWQCAAWWLERKHASKWAKKDNIQVDHSGNIEVDVIKEKLVERLERLSGDDHE